MLDVAQQINRRAHLVLDEVARLFGRPVAAEERLHVAAYAEARPAVVGEVNLVLVVNLLDEDFGHDEYRLFGRVAPARVRVELAYVLKLLDEFFNFHADLLGEVQELVLLQLRKRVLADEARGHAVLSAARALFAALHFELNEQAPARVARAAAYGVEVQDDASRLLNQFGGPAAEFGDLLVGGVEPAVAVEVADDALADGDKLVADLRHV